MRYLGFVLLTTALAGCSAAGIGGSQTNSCVPHCSNYIAPGYAAQTYPQTAYHQSYSQPYNYQASNQPVQAYYPTGYGSQPAPHAYGTHAHAQVPQLRGASNFYSERGYKYGNLGGILYDFDSKKYGVQGRIGYQSATILGAELEGSISLGSETEELSADAAAAVTGTTGTTTTPGTTTTTPSASTLTTEYTNSIAAFGLARLPVSDRLSIHSRAGLHSTRFKAELNDGLQTLRQNETSIGLAYGLGVEYAVTPKNNIRLDYTVYEGDAGGNADSLSVAVAHKF